MYLVMTFAARGEVRQETKMICPFFPERTDPFLIEIGSSLGQRPASIYLKEVEWDGLLLFREASSHTLIVLHLI